MEVKAITPMPWVAADERSEGWRIVSRARVDIEGGGLLNGLLVERSAWNTATNRSETQRGVVVWERPREGGLGRFRLLRM